MLHNRNLLKAIKLPDVEERKLTCQKISREAFGYRLIAFTQSRDKSFYYYVLIFLSSKNKKTKKKSFTITWPFNKKYNTLIFTRYDTVIGYVKNIYVQTINSVYYLIIYPKIRSNFEIKEVVGVGTN